MLLFLLDAALALSRHSALPRRQAISVGAAAATVAILTPSRRTLAAAAPGFESAQGALASSAIPAPGFERAGIGVGGGFDVLADNPLGVRDVLYPPFLNGTWECTHKVLSVDGDAGQAQGAWRLLGGSGDIRTPETYAVRFIDVRQLSVDESIVGLDGRRYYPVVLDRAYEMNSRARGASVAWDALVPNTLGYERAAGGLGAAAELKVVQRSVELPTESNKGWGSNELLRITTTSGSLLGGFNITYAARVQRRYRRGLDEATGEKIVEGLEIVKTYRVLDGVAGVEFPTSTTKSTVRLVRR